MGGGAGYDLGVKLNRQIVTKSTLRQPADNNFVPGSVAARVLMVWPITCEIAALSPNYDVSANRRGTPAN